MKNILLSLTLVVTCAHAMQQPAVVDTAEKQLTEYTAALPKIDVDSDKSTSTKIVEFLTQFSTKQIKSGQDVLKEKIEKRITMQKPIEFVLIGFPSKDINPNKVLSPEFDMADFVGLHTLNHMASQIQTVYKPGGHVSLYTREPQLDDVHTLTEKELGTGIFPQDVRVKYQEQLKRVIVAAQLKNIMHKQIDNVEELYKKERDNVRDDEKKSSGQKDKELEGMTIFWKHQFKGLETAVQKKHGLPSKTQATKFLASVAQRTAQTMFSGAKTMREVLKKNVPDYESAVRLSVRPSEDGNVANKLGVALVYGAEAGVPWISTLVANPAETGTKILTTMPHEKAKKLPNARKATYMIGGIPLAYMQCTSAVHVQEKIVAAKITDINT